MPIPKKRKDEDKTKFVSRCMSSEVMKKDYPDNQQRVAICLDQATADCDCVEAADFRLNFQNGYEEEIDEENFYIPAEAEYVDFEEQIEEWDVAGEKPGLWDNIRKKKERMGKNYKPAKPGDPDRPSKEAFKKAQSDDSYEEVDMLKSQINKIMTQANQMLQLLGTMENAEIPPWVQDSVSKAETHMETAYDYMLYSDEKDSENESETTDAAEKSKVKLNKPFRTPSGPKKFSVYVKNDKGNVVKVNFGDPNMEIKRDDPERRKSYRARHNCDNPGPKWKANYWSCKMWSKTNVSDLT
ncbi:MAG: hypothetical protein EBU90_03660 [Proteobacteria bacterium]|nr:hypothetical protein [Pseudomonadota bacterium]NBP13678.1 hypothetical protein [bacterium]